MKLSEILTEITKDTYVSAVRDSTDPEGTGKGDTDKIIARAKREQGDKFAKDLEGVHKGHWPKTYGKDEKEVPRGSDPLKNRAPTRKTKDGKVNKQDVNTLKTKIRGNR